MDLQRVGGRGRRPVQDQEQRQHEDPDHQEDQGERRRRLQAGRLQQGGVGRVHRQARGRRDPRKVQERRARVPQEDRRRDGLQV